jgi:hypothetical protein
VENARRLIDDAKSCKVHFALVQNGIAYPDGHQLELIGRLPRPESLVILGRNVERIREPADLKGLRIGIGPAGSGTEEMMRRVLVQLGTRPRRVDAADRPATRHAERGSSTWPHGHRRRGRSCWPTR